MPEDRLSDVEQAVSHLFLEIFRLNGRLLSAGDEVVAPIGLTSARWQVLGAIDLAPSPQPVAWLARSMGLSRQGVQRIVNELERERLVETTDNPNHLRARLVRLTAEGKRVYVAAQDRQKRWVAGLAAGYSEEDVATTRRVLKTLHSRLDM